MSHLSKKLSMVAVFAVITLFSVSEGRSQCVGCVPAPPGWICMAAGQGGEACSMDGMNCTLINPCTCKDRECPQGLMKSSSIEKIKISISDDMVREIGKTYPRLALALISIRKLPPLSYREGKINSASIEVTEADVEAHLQAPRKSKKYLSQLKKRVQESFNEGKTPSVIRFWIEQSLTGGAFVLKLQPEEVYTNDLSFTLLEVNLTSFGKSEINQSSFNSFEATTWKVN